MGPSIATIEDGGCKAEIYEAAMPGQFTIIYRDPAGQVLEESELSGVSSYRQRESEITEHLRKLCSGEPIDPEAEADLQSPGEY